MSDFGVLGAGATVLLGDNQGALSLARNPLHSAQSKHIDVLYHFVRERVAMGELSVEYVSTAEMVADLLTKPLPAPRFVRGVPCADGGALSRWIRRGERESSKLKGLRTGLDARARACVSGLD